MLIITYDEHGGFYDHVPPGAAKPTGSKGSDHGFMFDQLGPRVPAIVISPLIPKGNSAVLGHARADTVAPVVQRLPLKHARDLHSVCGLLHLASLPAPRDTPDRLPAVVVSDFKPAPPSPGGDDLTVRGAVSSRAAISVTPTVASPAGGTPGVTGPHPVSVHGVTGRHPVDGDLQLLAFWIDRFWRRTRRTAWLQRLFGWRQSATWRSNQRKAEIAARVSAIKTGGRRSPTSRKWRRNSRLPGVAEIAGHTLRSRFAAQPFCSAP